MMTEWGCGSSAPRTGFTLLGLHPQLFPFGGAEGLQRPALCAGERFHEAKTALELAVGPAQGSFGIHTQVAPPVRQGEQQIAELFLHVLAVRAACGASHGLVGLGELFGHLLAHLWSAFPVETNTRCASPQFRRSCQCREGSGHIRERTCIRALAALGSLGPLARLELLPGSRLLLGTGDAGAGKHMRVTPNQLVVNRSSDGGEVEPAALLGHACVE